MAQAGLHAAFGYQIGRIIPPEKRLLPAIIFGAILPDIDIIIVALAHLFYPLSHAEKLFHRSFTHSFFAVILIYLIFSILSEWKNQPQFKSIGKGLALGILSHILLDTLFWFREIQFLWPLPLRPFSIWNFLNLPRWIPNMVMTFDFFFFYWYAWFLINKHIESPNKQSWIIKYLQIWKKWESILFLFFIFLSLWSSPVKVILFGAAYIPSIIISLWATYMSRDALETKQVILNN